jgi:DNA-binding Lrp family transcriptional regulator
MEQLDSIDKHILMALQANARLNAKELAQIVGLSVTPTYERLKKLDKLNLIAGYVTLLKPDAIDRSLMVWCNVSLRLHSLPLLRAFEQAVEEIDEVMECYHIAGNYDYLLKVAVKDMNAYQHFITVKLASLDNIANVQSSFVMTPVKHKTVYSL